MPAFFRLAGRLRRLIGRRTYLELEETKIRLGWWQTILFELYRRFRISINPVEWIYDYNDSRAARLIRSSSYTAVISPIGASSRVFEEAKSREVKRILYLPIMPFSCVVDDYEREVARGYGESYGVKITAERMSLERNEIDEADIILCPSIYVKHRLEECFPVAAPKARLVPFGIDKSKDLKFAGRQFNRPLRVIFVGQVVQRKGIIDLLEAVKEFCSDELILTVVGKLPSGSKISLNGTNIDYKGVLGRERVGKELRMHDVLCLPSQVEGMPLVVLEALSVGLPVITTIVCEGVVKDGLNGYVVEKRNPVQLAAVFRKILAVPQLLEELSQGALKSAAECTWEMFRERVVAAVRPLVAK